MSSWTSRDANIKQSQRANRWIPRLYSGHCHQTDTADPSQKSSLDGRSKRGRSCSQKSHAKTGTDETQERQRTETDKKEKEKNKEKVQVQKVKETLCV